MRLCDKPVVLWKYHITIQEGTIVLVSGVTRDQQYATSKGSRIPTSTEVWAMTFDTYLEAFEERVHNSVLSLYK